MEFLERHSGYATEPAVEDLRKSEYRRLDDHGHTYVDCTGGGLHAESQVT